jgi:hypothetical protein
MGLTLEERELKFRRFIKLRAKGTPQSVILREVGKNLVIKCISKSISNLLVYNRNFRKNIQKMENNR